MINLLFPFLSVSSLSEEGKFCLVSLLEGDELSCFTDEIKVWVSSMLFFLCLKFRLFSPFYHLSIFKITMKFVRNLHTSDIGLLLGNPKKNFWYDAVAFLLNSSTSKLVIIFFHARELEKNPIYEAASSGSKSGLALAEKVKTTIEQSDNPESVAMMSKPRALSTELWREKSYLQGWWTPPAPSIFTGRFWSSISCMLLHNICTFYVACLCFRQ
jgi:hypothetical protein